MNAFQLPVVSEDGCVTIVTDTHTQVGDKVDARDPSMGAWFEAQVVKVTEEDTPTSKEDEPSSSTSSEPTLLYHVKFDE